VPFELGPGFEGMVGEGGVAVFAGIVGGAAFHFDGDDVGGAVVVEAAGLGVEVEAADFGSGWGHGTCEGSRIAEMSMGGKIGGRCRSEHERPQETI